jgi:hypothetical protein
MARSALDIPLSKKTTSPVEDVRWIKTFKPLNTFGKTSTYHPWRSTHSGLFANETGALQKDEADNQAPTRCAPIEGSSFHAH